MEWLFHIKTIHQEPGKKKQGFTHDDSSMIVQILS